jgi:hypothetical protein
MIQCQDKINSQELLAQSADIRMRSLCSGRLKKVQGKKKAAAARDTLERESRQAEEGKAALPEDRAAAEAPSAEQGNILQDVDEDVIF